MNYKKSALALLLGVVVAGSACAANSLTYQGVTFNTWAVDSSTMGLSILNATSATGDWTGIQYLKSFEIKNIVSGSGQVGSVTSFAGPGSFASTVTSGLSANGCATGGTSGACFTSLPAVQLTSNMTWTIGFTPTVGSVMDFSLPHLKVYFMTNANATSKAGSLLSQDITAVTAVPEPETYAMLLAGLGLIGTIARRRSSKSV